jgi:CubicO group peptidase (beta-lactamase class C family)
MTRAITRLPLLLLVVLLAGQVRATPVLTSPSSVAIDPAALESFDHDIASSVYPLVDSLLVMRCGLTVFDKRYSHDYGTIYDQEAHTRGPLNAHLTGPYNYFDPNWHPYLHGTELHSIQSITKTVTAAIIGVAVQRGDFKASLDTPVLHYFDERKVANVDARKRRMTLRHLLTMTSGLDWNEDVAYDDPINGSSLMEASDDWVGFVINRPMKDEPGTVFTYSSGSAELLAHVFRKETGQDIEAYARRYFFAPLGIRHYHWKRTPLKVVDTEGGLYLSTRDLATFGELYLHDGTVHGRRLLPSRWVKDSLTPQIDTHAGYQYGYLWWLLPHGDPATLAYVARGMSGQRILVVPEQDLVIVSTAWHVIKDYSIEHALVQRLLPAVHPHRCTAP